MFLDCVKSARTCESIVSSSGGKSSTPLCFIGPEPRLRIILTSSWPMPLPNTGTDRHALPEHHPLIRRFTPYREGAILKLPTIMCETQKHEGLRFSLPTPFPISSGEPPKLDQPGL